MKRIALLLLALASPAWAQVYVNGDPVQAYSYYLGVATASLQTCNSAREGALAYDTTLNVFSWCDGSAWAAMDTIASGTTPISGGADTQVCFNDAGTIKCGDAGLVYDEATDILSGPAAIRTGDGSAAAPAYAFSGDIDTGFAMFPGGGATYVASGGVYRMRLGTSLILRDGVSLCFDASGDPDGCESTIIRDAANTLAQRNGTNAQAFRLYNTWTDASNNEYLDFLWSGNAHYIRTFKTGSGLARTLYLRSASTLYLQSEGGTQSWAMSAGHLKPETDNAYDIGASGATRPRTGYFGTSVVAPLFTATGTIAATSTTNVGWTPVAAADQACDMTCTNACLVALANGTVGVSNSAFVACSDATADQCVCGGSS